MPDQAATSCSDDQHCPSALMEQEEDSGCTGRPDIDNQMKTAADAQIVDARLSRRYGPESVTVIEVRPL